MNRAEVLYLIPYFGSLLISIGVLAFTWSRRSAQGAIAFAWYVLGQILWITGFIFELISTDIASKIFWDEFQWIAGFFALIALPVFAVQYTELKLKSPRMLFRLLFVVPVIFLLFLLSDQAFHWIYINPRLIPSTLFTELLYDFTPIVYGYAIYVYAITLWGLYLLIRRIIQPHGLYRAQVALITLGFFIPIFGSFLSLLNIHSCYY